MQLTLDAPELTPPPAAFPNLHDHDAIVICSSGGQDSTAMTAYLAEQITTQNYTDPVVVIHNDLGTTDTGEPIEWAGAEQLAREHAAAYGFRFEVLRREKGGLWQQLLTERHLWMGERARWCTADQKTSQGMKFVTRLTTELRDQLGITGRPVRVLYCLGLRAEESAGRRKQPPLAVDTAHSSGARTVTRWLPIHAWTLDQVWEQIRKAGLRTHDAYTRGMARLSCRLCILASVDDLMLSGALNPAVLADYRRAERELGHRFTATLSITQITAALTAARLALTNPDLAAVQEGTLYHLTREIVDEQNELRTGTYVRTGKPRRWTAQQVDERTRARVAQLMVSARRAIRLATSPLVQ
ncbi:phosphoadenosine phosphosulfate reductase family protein [Streptosporangium sp. NPDC051022]|uniref:phosphoadenosine phosphosulfate reductase domain-containing protein n=1 Tax=Streptosporangium sp. NPDC051022 TaxID=3155752 RepID=UPI00342F114C